MFGDNGTATGANPSHTYNNPGTYTVTLTATDAANQKASAPPLRIIATAPPPPGGSVNIAINNASTHQRIVGWGAEYPVEGFSVPVAQRPQLLSNIYGLLKFTSTQAGSLLEAPVPDFTKTQNSDPDPNVINWAGFQGWAEQSVYQGWINLQSATKDSNGNLLTAEQLGLTGYVLGDSFPNIKWENKWLDGVRNQNVSLYRDYLAREVLAYHLYYKNNFGKVPSLFQFGNEEITGNGALFGLTGDSYPGGPTQEMVDLIKTAGLRLANNGFGNVKFLASTEETVSSSLALATAILADPTARQYVAAIAYHEYPYGSAYSDLSQILQSSGQGTPPANEIQIRNQIRDLGKQYGLPVWLTEVSHGSTGGLSGASFDTLRARAIDIHDNLVYADIVSFWLQGDEWDTVAQLGHFGTNETVDQLIAEQGGDMAMIGDPNANVWKITMGGYAVGHYSRWVAPGNIRVDGTSDSPLVQVTAFRDDTSRTESLVLINNSSQPQQINLTLTGATFAGGLTGEQSTAAATLQPLSSIPASATAASFLVPALSVTSLSAPLGP